MFRWKFLQYVSPNGRHSITDWRSKLPVQAQADLDTFLKNMAKTESWEFPDIRALKGARYRILKELRWKSGGVQYRIFGYQTHPAEFVMLIGCTHKGNNYNPPDALETARRRQNQVKSNEASTCEYKLTVS